MQAVGRQIGDDTALADRSEDLDLPEPMDSRKLAEALLGLGQALEGLDTEALAGSDSDGNLSGALEGLTAGMQELAQDAKNHKIRMARRRSP